MDSFVEFDYVIIGGGSAGALLANRLSADPSRSVLLVEAGGPDDYPWIHIPVGYLYCIDNPRTDWRFRTEAEAGLNGRSLLYPRGKVLGGCSSINGMLYMRGQARDYDGWAALAGEPDWSWAGVLPDFKRHENHHRLRGRRAPEPVSRSVPSQPMDPTQRLPSIDEDVGTWHGGDGEWRVEKQRLRWDILDAFAQAAQQAGVPATDDFNRGSNEGVGYFEVNQKNGWRWNASKAFLRPILKHRRNLTLWTRTHASRLVLEPGGAGALRCKGAWLVRGGDRVQVRARREVILSAGAIGTPQLLQLSGIGPGGLLQRHGIGVLRDAPGVGSNLQDHLQVRAVFKVDNVKTLNTMAGSLWGKALIGLEYAWRRTGPMSMAPSQLCAITRSDPGRPHPNIQFHVQPLSLPAFGQPLHRFAAITASVCNLNPTSRGTVAIRSADPGAAPLIAPNYLSTDEDRKVAADSLRVARRIVAQPAMARYGPTEYLPGAEHQGDDALAQVAGDIATTIFHPVGTARMGRADDPGAVVDPQLRVIGVAGLRVVDASVMPRITSGNTNSPTLMVAEKAARWILAER
ncbi:GMC family oxidoreductase N-terminal domain-containing protein [Ramlibacter sp. AW1]|uniref:GMC family oxidoreductase N-terminal domain-containing protein n=1 Tax=Ramlibacter aurantiacus TaxID=2801330 RepID=A0A937D1X4_9BURK|nr:GMC family oxidoreductase N-terminal domain-containing protein [Ramlibacter aurantiacus]MBL0419210.1 GMC family oxidoreductase N-terminal domain-containing protein [Ramlibacter aurantiacus]